MGDAKGMIKRVVKEMGVINGVAKGNEQEKLTWQRV